MNKLKEFFPIPLIFFGGIMADLAEERLFREE
jgi:hypothetical protein